MKYVADHGKDNFDHMPITCCLTLWKCHSLSFILVLLNVCVYFFFSPLVLSPELLNYLSLNLMIQDEKRMHDRALMVIMFCYRPTLDGL